jgi:hypothetical protein
MSEAWAEKEEAENRVTAKGGEARGSESTRTLEVSAGAASSTAGGGGAEGPAAAVVDEKAKTAEKVEPTKSALEVVEPVGGQAVAQE